MNQLEKLPEDVKRTIKLSAIFRNYHRNISKGMPYHLILDSIFEDLKQVIPFERIGIALLDDDNGMIKLHWVKSELPIKWLKEDYSANYKTSSLKKILETGEARIINDLESYFLSHPESLSTNLALRDGIKSNLTCPLKYENKPIGVVFFSSSSPYTYEKNHVEIFNEVAEEISLLISYETIKSGKSFSGLLRELKSTCWYFLKRFKEIELKNNETKLAENLQNLILQIDQVTMRTTGQDFVTNAVAFFNASIKRFQDNDKRIKINLDISRLPDQIPVTQKILDDSINDLLKTAINKSFPFSSLTLSSFINPNSNLITFQVETSNIIDIDINQLELPLELDAKKFCRNENEGTVLGFDIKILKH